MLAGDQLLVKICCITNLHEAALAVSAGASALGLVSHMPSGPGTISDEDIRAIARKIPAPVRSFLLTCRQTAQAIVEQHRYCQTTTLQLVDRVEADQLQQVRQQLPEVEIVQVIHVVDSSSIAEATSVAPLVDAILLDSGNPQAETKQLGGTGRTHNWQISREIRDCIDIPLILAGGLNEQNILEAIDRVQPAGVDLCSSLRSHASLDAEKLAAFMQKLKPLNAA